MNGQEIAMEGSDKEHHRYKNFQPIYWPTIFYPFLYFHFDYLLLFITFKTTYILIKHKI
jgi:hypothetical protein